MGTLAEWVCRRGTLYNEVAMSFFLDSAGFYRPTAFGEVPWLFAGFGTRAAAVPEQLATVQQVHSADVIRVEKAGPAGTGDGLITDAEGPMVGVKTADCIPLLMVDMNRRAVAAVHAGWRGTAQRIGPKAIEAMRAAFGSQLEDVHVAIGPGIGACCYEVGSDVAGAFPGYKDRTHLDLSRINREQLEAVGVASKQIHEAGLCTFCRDEFFSFRREREKAGRMISIIGKKTGS